MLQVKAKGFSSCCMFIIMNKLSGKRRKQNKTTITTKAPKQNQPTSQKNKQPTKTPQLSLKTKLCVCCSCRDCDGCELVAAEQRCTTEWVLADYWRVCAAVYFSMTLKTALKMKQPSMGREQAILQLLSRYLWSWGGSRAQWQVEWRGSAQSGTAKTGHRSHVLPTPLCLPLWHQCRHLQVSGWDIRTHLLQTK